MRLEMPSPSYTLVASNWSEQESQWVVITKTFGRTECFGPFDGTRQTTAEWAAMEVDADDYKIVELSNPATNKEDE